MIETRLAGEAVKRVALGPAVDEDGLFPLGARVMHGRLGAGEVVAASGGGDRRKVTVKFDAGLELEILEKYGGLELEETSEMPY